MSEDTFARCVALELIEPVYYDAMYDVLCDYLEDTYGTREFSVQFGSDFIAVYQEQNFEEHYGITKVGVISENFRRVWRVLDSMCRHNKIKTENEPKYFTDFWYNGVECTASGMHWENL